MPRPHFDDAVEDVATIDACRKGDRAALARVFHRHGPALERLLRRLVGPGADAEDLLQDTFVAVIHAFPRFRGQAPLRIWMTRIAVHIAHDHLHAPARRRRAKLHVVGDPAPSEPRPSAEQVVEGRQALARVYEHLDALPPKKRIAFLLHVVEQRPLAEVAALMSATKAATKSRVWLARRAMLDRARRDPALTDLLTPKEPEP